MEYQKIENFLDYNLSNQPSKFRTKNWVEIDNESKESYKANSTVEIAQNVAEAGINYSKYTTYFFIILIL